VPKPSAIITTVAALMNDAAQSNYTNAACLPYLNLALNELQEIYEQNDIPVTHETSAAITVKAGVSSIGLDTNPALPSDFIELQQLWESPEGLEQWTPLIKREYLPHQLQDGTTISQFLIYAWKKGRISLIAANQDNDLKLDYIASMFNTPILIKDINVNLPFTNIKTYLDYKTAALCALFIAENPSRALALDALTGTALTRALGIPIKGMQSVITRRRPFRQAHKNRSRGVLG
jgi:hypothetical protein